MWLPEPCSHQWGQASVGSRVNSPPWQPKGGVRPCLGVLIRHTSVYGYCHSHSLWGWRCVCVSTCVHVDMQAHTPQGLTAVSTSVCVCIAAQGTVYLCSHPCALQVLTPACA